MGECKMSVQRFYMPTLSLFGSGSLQEAGKEIKSLGFAKALVVTGKHAASSGRINLLTKILDENNISYTIYSEVQPNPTMKNVHDGVEVLKKENCDFVISYGGGSPHDCAKGIALIATNGGKIKDYAGVNKSKKPQLPLIAVNTTAGTAAEMTIFSIITDEERNVKMAIVDKNINPIIAVNDPITMKDMPPSLTAATGMDALTHAIEAYVSIAATPITDACAIQAISLISQNIEKAVNNGDDIEARNNMAYAQYLAGMAFNNASLGYVHAMSHQLGGAYDLPHGMCNAVLLPHVQKFNAKFVPQKIAQCGKALGVNIENLSPQEASDKTIQKIVDLNKAIGIPKNLTEIGVKEEDIPKLADNALADVCGLTNPKQATKEEIIQIYTSAM
jgi:alcohol dehydrogenase